MKKIISIVLLIFISRAYALDVSVKYEGKGRFTATGFERSSLNKERIFDIVTDLENQCMQGCIHYLPSIRESVILERVSVNEFYTWTYVDDLIDAQFFSKIVISENTVTYSNPTPSKINSLEKNRYEHDPVFFKRFGEWKVKEIFKSDGSFSHSNIYFKLDVTTKNRLAKTFSGRVKKKIKSGIKDNYKLFK